MLKQKLEYLSDKAGDLEGFEAFAFCVTLAILILVIAVVGVVAVVTWPFLLLIIPFVILFTTVRTVRRIWKDADEHLR